MTRSARSPFDAAEIQLAHYLPMFDPDHFRDAAFFRELARIGYRQVLLGGTGTAGWFYDAFRLPSDKVLLGYASYARMVGYRHLALDYEDPNLDIDPKLIAALRRIPDIQLVISDEFTVERAKTARALGADTLITPSDVYEEAADPLALAAAFHAALLA